MPKIAHQVDTHTGEHFLGQESKDVLQQGADKGDDTDKDEDIQLAGRPFTVIVHIIIEGIFEPGSFECKGGQLANDRTMAGIEQDIEQGNEQGKIYEAKDDEKEYIYDILRDIMMVRP